MDFNSPKPIFLQICDLIMDKVLNQELAEGERIPSVRDCAEEISVNPNTVQRAYSELQTKGIIVQQRGIGYFIATGGKELAQQLRRDEFFRLQLPKLVEQMKILGISWDELIQINDQGLGQNFSNKVSE
jgi:DNA-binding transcriptional regulator YhcF (GntR family)